jgi:hypothetical protein
MCRVGRGGGGGEVNGGHGRGARGGRWIVVADGAGGEGWKRQDIEDPISSYIHPNIHLESKI